MERSHGVGELGDLGLKMNEVLDLEEKFIIDEEDIL